jgi:hypothetical protein
MPCRQKGGGIALLIADICARRGQVVNATPQPLYPRERAPVPIVAVAVWASGAVWMGPESLIPTRVQTMNHVPHSESLYQIYYPDHPYIQVSVV